MEVLLGREGKMQGMVSRYSVPWRASVVRAGPRGPALIVSPRAKHLRYLGTYLGRT